MSTFAFVFVCIQACLVQNVFSQQCLGAYGSTAFAPTTAYIGNGFADIAYPTANWVSAYPGYTNTYSSSGYGMTPTAAYGGAFAPGAAYGGAGEGNVAVAGELPVAGTTAVAGQVPIMGAVSFGGPVAAAGAVSVNGQCACGCGSPYYY